jgi:hypothetical protein
VGGIPRQLDRTTYGGESSSYKSAPALNQVSQKAK